MMKYDPSRYGDSWAAYYDLHYGPWSAELDPAAAVRFIVSRAANGPVLELGVGTGRVAIPLAESGLEVDGLDSSKSMLAQLAAKSGSASVRQILADMADFQTGRSYAVVVCLFNSVLMLPTMELQQRCFRSVAESLGKGAAFIVEAIVPKLEGFSGDATIELRDTPLGRQRRETVLDQRAHTLRSTYIAIDRPMVHAREVLLRYSTTDELDSMAHRAGLRLTERWSDWDEAPFTDSSREHISVYRRH